MAAFDALLTPRARVLAITRGLERDRHRGAGARVRRQGAAGRPRHVVDGAQAVAHYPVDVRALGCDFYAFSGHKMYGPTGIGVLYGRFDALDALPPWQGGGDMIETVTFDRPRPTPACRAPEAGTPTSAARSASARRSLARSARPRRAAHERDLLRRSRSALRGCRGCALGAGAPKVGAVSFVVDGVHPHDVGTMLDQFGVAVRTGHHCAQPVMDRFGVPATAARLARPLQHRADIDALVGGARTSRQVSADERARRPVPGAACSTTSAGRATSARWQARPAARGRQPAVRRQWTVYVQLGARRRGARSPSRARAARSASPRRR